MGRILLNCDLGEGEEPVRTEALVRHIDAANIACGGHAGDRATMRRCLDLCQMHSVLPGAHPGMRGEFGRGADLPSPADFQELLKRQLEDFTGAADECGLSLHHIKLHGTLYHAVEHSDVLAAVYLEFLSGLHPAPVVFSMARGVFAQRARRAGFDVREEFLADRAYLAPTVMVPRSEPGAVVRDADEVMRRVGHWVETGEILTVDGRALPLEAQTLCVHADSPEAVRAAEKIAAILHASGSAA